MKVKIFVACMCVVVIACGGGEDESTVPNREAVGSIDLQRIAADKLEAACTSDITGVECRKLLGNLVEREDSTVLDAVERWLFPACAAETDSACLHALRNLVARGRLQAVERLIAAGDETTGAVCSGLDPATVSVLDGRWCESYSFPEACAGLVECRVTAGDEVMVARKRQLEIRTIVAEVVETHGTNAGAALLKRVPAGEEGIRRLLDLAADGPGITLRERNLIVSAVEAAGVKAYPALVSMIEHDRIEVGLLAARAGWDKTAYEEEDDRPNEEPNRTVTLDESVDYLGKRLTIFLRDGTKREGVLKRIEGEYLHLEVSIGGGAMTMKLRQSDVERIAF